jgi:hypothetical protein
MSEKMTRGVPRQPSEQAWPEQDTGDYLTNHRRLAQSPGERAKKPGRRDDNRDVTNYIRGNDIEVHSSIVSLTAPGQQLKAAVAPPSGIGCTVQRQACTADGDFPRFLP